MKLTPKRQSGFTLIEIVIVLAIAALIMVIVFVAVQGAQRARRDTATKNDVNRVVALAESYASANSGVYPATAAQITDFQDNWVRKDIATPQYTITNAVGSAAAGTININAGGTCTGATIVAGTGKGMAASTTLEAGKYCTTTN